jgi:hypothetical protein
VANGNFATGSFSGWTLGGDDTPDVIYINTSGEGGSTYAAAMGSVGSDGTISQTVATTAGQTYTLSFWLQNEASGPNDFSAIWNGQTLLSLTNQAAFGYTEHTYTVTATSSSTVLEFSARQDPSHWDLDNISLTATGTASAPLPTAPVIQTAAVNPNTDPTVTLTGIAPAGSTVTVSDGGVQPLGTTTASSTGIWSFTTLDLAPGSYAFTATDTTSAGTSAVSSTFNLIVPSPPAAPVIETGLANTHESTTLTGTAPAGSTVTVSDGGSKPLGTTTASSTGTWSYTTAALAAGSYAFTATDSSSAGTSAASTAFTVTVKAPPARRPAAPVVKTGVANTRGSVTVTGTAPAGSTVTVSDGGSKPLGTTTASSTGTWSYATAALAAGSYVITATDSTSAGTSAASSAFTVTVKAPSAPPPAAPVITSDVVHQNGTVTLTGTAQPYTLVTVYDSGRLLGRTIARASGAWTYTTSKLHAGEQVFTATATDSAGTSAVSRPLDSPVGATSAAGLVVSNSIQAGKTFELSEPYSGSITFDGSTGMLKLDHPSTFNGEIFNFSGNGSLSGSDQIDLKGIDYNSVRGSYTNGVLTVTDGQGDTAKLHFNGSYSLANFNFASDGHGGAIVYDPPLPAPTNPQAASTGACSPLDDSSAFAGMSSGIGAPKSIDLPPIAFDPQTTLGYFPDRQPTGGSLSLTTGTHGFNNALLGTYMASSFAMTGDNHGSAIAVGEAMQSHHPLLAGPQHG